MDFTISMRAPLSRCPHARQASQDSESDARAFYPAPPGKNRYPCRDQVMFLLSLKAGLRAKEIAALTWAMVTDAEGTYPI